MFLEQQISILELFLKFSFALTGINAIFQFVKMENNYFKLKQ